MNKYVFLLLALVCATSLVSAEIAEGDVRFLKELVESLAPVDEAVVFERWPRNIKRFTNKWQQIGPIWGR